MSNIRNKTIVLLQKSQNILPRLRFLQFVIVLIESHLDYSGFIHDQAYNAMLVSFSQCN